MNATSPDTMNASRLARTPRSGEQISPAFACRWGGLLTLGVVQAFGGAAAMAVPFIATLIAAATFAWLLLFAGAFHVLHAFRIRTWKGFALHLLSGVLYAGAGVLILWRPWPGIAGLTLVLAALLMFEGAMRIVLSLRIRPRDGWGWFLAGGAMSIALGGVLLAGWPAISLWAIGLLLGVQLIFAGAMNTALALRCRARQNAGQTEAQDKPRDLPSENATA